MTLETWMSTGTRLSLKAVVMKQPNVKAAMTLREKANREFALDKTVFIFELQLQLQTDDQNRTQNRSHTLRCAS
ncbi:Hypothetical protein SMAX5B_004889 [Scophthalmus maximus]|uniref:Uncharacterized protein n=1 Tax=Scophthalmus maximus TaxID=52904 RepID=A0A2U9BR31_SCOMX|nr:Hypothetical protein SMAX5B_004889 [Scophthalmus maximus]KAF0037956.1 hypothetical protein F2P81_010830 [Scophthalmus maximus]